MIKLSTFLNLFMILMLSTLFLINLKSAHPISLLIFLIIYSLAVCLILSIQSFNFMFSIMFFLMMISGLLIIFLYFASLISNEQNKFNLSPLLIITKIMNTLILSALILSFFKYYYYNSFEMNNTLLINLNLFHNIFNIFNYPFNNLTLLSMMYLLITLFSIIKICSIKSSPLRKLK